MNLILILILTLAIVLAALELRRRVRKKAAPRGGGERYRAARGNLNLARPGRTSRPQRGRNSLAVPVLLTVVLLLLGLWLAASYLLPGRQAPVAALDSQADAAPAAPTRSLAGRLTGGDPPPANGPISQAAQATVGGRPDTPLLPPLNEAPAGPLATAAQAGPGPSASLDQLGRRLEATESQAPAAAGPGRPAGRAPPAARAPAA
ncbi:MAG: hypothetical protein LBP33_02110, partial [Candidatus Adiutrix sp.]|nr:hypothetical protein [Candidatus Adiutrix sp.]